MGRDLAAGFLGWISWPILNRQAKNLLERLGLSLLPSRKMKELSVAEMQRVEIAKALSHNAELIIMDEPTSALSQREVQRLFNVILDQGSRPQSNR